MNKELIEKINTITEKTKTASITEKTFLDKELSIIIAQLRNEINYFPRLNFV